MAALNGEAEVLSATCPVNQENVATGGRGSSVIESLQTFWSCPLPEDGLERPHKRRRLNEDNDISIRAEVARQPYVTLAHITLDLRLPACPEAFSLDWKSKRSSIQVQLLSVQEVSPQIFQLEMLNDASSQNLTISATSDDLPAMVVHLEHISRFRHSYLQRQHTDFVSVDCCLQQSEHNVLVLEMKAKLLWRVGASTEELVGKKAILRQTYSSLLGQYFGTAGRDHVTTPWSPQDFYDCVHVPPKDHNVSPLLQTSLLDCTLYPFQQRAVDWLLRREGVHLSKQGLVSYRNELEIEKRLPPSFSTCTDATGLKCYYSQLQGLVLTDPASMIERSPDIRGGILAEEMGLGKTVELIALICLHKRQHQGSPVYDNYSGSTVTPSQATLIITPSSILHQWKTELATHAPSLRVLDYQGMPSVARASQMKGELSVSDLLGYDVVLTTYNVLGKEIWYATTGPERSLRHEKKHQRRRSLLTMIHWWRVCLDEAQMVEGGVSNAAVVARSIPRQNAWAVSGTPLRKNVQDLYGLLLFLRFEPYCSTRSLWKRTVKSYKDVFQQIFGQLTLRHTKDKVREELRLPPQKRVVLTVPFTAVEEQNYAQLFQQMYESCGLRADGSPANGDWNPDDPNVTDNMRMWLTRLRQTCLHPKVGNRNLRALGRGNRSLRTVEEVLEVMIEQNETQMRYEERAMVMAGVLGAHIQGNAKNEEKRCEVALDGYLAALHDANEIVDDCRRELSACLAEKPDNMAPGGDEWSAEDDLSDQDQSQPEKGGRVALLRKHLRSALETQHACAFFAATCYYQIKTDKNLTQPDSDDFKRLERLENDLYEKAKAIRKEILHDPHGKATRSMRKVSRKAQQTKVASNIPELEDYGGIENRKILEKLDFLSDVLNEQARTLLDWRKKLIELLLLPLIDQDEGKEITGEEYEDSAKKQDEVYVYMTALRAMFADRYLGLTGQENLLIEHEIKLALSQAKSGEGHAPQLFVEIMDTRAKLKPSADGGSLRGIVAELRSLVTALQWQKEGGSQRAGVELAVVESQLKEVQSISTAQAKDIAELERELELFRTTMNLRLDYYRQLQQISDTVAPYKEELDEELDQRALDKHREHANKIAKRLATSRTKRRFLLHLRAESSDPQSQRLCVICQSSFDDGVLTVCGHQYCKECIGLWWQSHRTCPVCKRHLSLLDFHQITYKSTKINAQEEHHQIHTNPSMPESASSSGVSIYSDISDSTLREIKAIDLSESYGTKIDAITRHVLWLRNNDPGAKSIIFSQYSDFLSVLEGAFDRFRIGFTRITSKEGVDKFRTDPSVECFLLDAKADSSGLNLVNATHVFLCEPLINTAIELQAVARVHRIGQKRATTVYMYLVSDTVEQAIYEVSVARRLEHVGRRLENGVGGAGSGSVAPMLQEAAIDAANSWEMEQASLARLFAKERGGGEVVRKEDLWRCLFSKPRRRLSGSSRELELAVGRHLRASNAEERVLS